MAHPLPLHPAEEATILAFVVPDRRPRYFDQLADPRRRARLLDQLNHCRDLNPRYARPARHVTAEDLHRLGAPQRCHVISEAAALDGRTMSLQDALVETAARGWGTIVCCVPGRLAYYRDELGEREYLLVRDEEG